MSNKNRKPMMPPLPPEWIERVKGTLRAVASPPDRKTMNAVTVLSDPRLMNAVRAGLEPLYPKGSQ